MKAAAQEVQGGRIGGLRQVVEQGPRAGGVRGADRVDEALDELADLRRGWREFRVTVHASTYPQDWARRYRSTG